MWVGPSPRSTVRCAAIATATARLDVSTEYLTAETIDVPKLAATLQIPARQPQADSHRAGSGLARGLWARAPTR
jgi:hypothetical protein